MIGEAECEGIVMASTRSSTTRIARTFSCSVLRIDGVFRRMLMPSEAENARTAGTAAENTKEAIDALVIHDDTRARAETA